MALSSMTGFARTDGAHSGLSWHWEAKSVNGRALDVRCRLPAGFEALEVPVREAAAKAFRRGSLQVSLQLTREAGAADVRINETVLERVVAIAEDLRRRLNAPPPQVEQLLALRGVLDMAEPVEDEERAAEREAALLESLAEAFKGLAEMRASEGAKLEGDRKSVV